MNIKDSTIDSQYLLQEEWNLQHYIDEAQVYSVDDEYVSSMPLVRKLLSLSRHSSYHLESLVDCIFSVDKYVIKHITCLCAEYNKKIGIIGDDEFVTDALEKCLLAGIIAVLQAKRNDLDRALYTDKNDETVWEKIIEYDFIQNWKEHLLLQEDLLRAANDNYKLENQLTTVIQFLYSFSGLKYQKTGNLRQLNESYMAAYCYGQILAIFLLKMIS